MVKAGALLLTLSPMVALAQKGNFNQGNLFSTYIASITAFINNTLIPFVFGIALLMFIWGMFKFFIYNTEEEKEKGKDLAIYAIVAFVLMVSIWGIVNLIAGGLGFSGQPLQNTPKTPTGAV